MNTEELTALKQETEALNAKLRQLTEEELKQVIGGDSHCGIYIGLGQMTHNLQQEEIDCRIIGREGRNTRGIE